MTKKQWQHYAVIKHVTVVNFSENILGPVLTLLAMT